MDDLSLLVDLHREGQRQGPGGDDETRLAITLSGLSGRTGLKIADIGCGTGASTLVLAQALDASVTAVDFLPDFLRDLEIAAERQNLMKRIETLAASMDALPFAEQSFDAIWSEGAIYNIGFANGIKAWRRFLKPDGILAVSELTWLTQDTIALADDSLVIPLSTDIALVAADLSLSQKLAFADAVIYASARKYNVELVTSDDHFKDLPGVTYFPKNDT